jgi:CheY-like chemotaxis protein
MQALATQRARPHRDDARASPSSPAPEPARQSRNGSNQGLKVLLVEDNKLNQKFAQALLMQAGHDVTIAENGQLAVEALRGTDYDVVLMDVQMPVMDGLQATKVIRGMAHPKCRVPIIMLTANAMAGARDHYIASGADDYVAKPISVEVLLGKLSSIALAHASPRQEPRDSDGMNWDLVTAAQRVFSKPAFRAFINDHIADTARRIATMHDALQAGQLQDIVHDAHALISTAGNVGSARVSELARAIEQHARSANVTEVGALVSELQDAAATASDRLQAFNASPATPALTTAL